MTAVTFAPSRLNSPLGLALLSPLALAALLAAMMLSSASVARSERYVLEGSDVAIYNLAGKVTLEPSSERNVTIEMTRGGSESDRLKCLTGSVGGRAALRVIYPSRRIRYAPYGRGSRTTLHVRSDGTFGGHDSGHWLDINRVTISGSDGVDAHADLRILVPKGHDVLLRLAVGSASATGVDSRLFLDLASGGVTTSRTHGDLSIDTGSGSVQVTDASGEVTLDTGSGSVEVHGVKGKTLSIDTGSGSVEAGDLAVSRLHVDTGSGGVELQDVQAPEVEVDTGSGEVQLDLDSDVESLMIDTGSGEVGVRVPKETGAIVALETGSGGLDVDLPLSDLHRDHGELHGQLGDGRGRIKIETGSGGIRIKGR